MSDRVLTITKAVNLGRLAQELRVLSPSITGCSLDAGTQLIVHGGTSLNEAQILAAIAAHVLPPPPVDPVVAAIDTALTARSVPAILDALAAIKAERQR